MNDTVPVIDTRAGFAAALRWGFQQAGAQQARRIVCADPDFADWPLDDTELLLGLGAWLRMPQRRLVLLAGHYRDVPRRLPRFCAWRLAYSHAIEAWEAPEELATEMPTVLASDNGISVNLVERLHWKGHAARDDRTARQWLDRCDAILQRSERGFAVGTLGLLGNALALDILAGWTDGG